MPGTSLVGQMVKHLPTMWETWVQSLGGEDLLEKEMATHSSILAWKIPWTEEPGRLQSMGLQRVGHDWGTSLSLYFHLLHVRSCSRWFGLFKFTRAVILQARLQQYMNREIPGVQAGFRRGRGTRDKIANICWIIEKAREFQKNIYFCFLDYAKAFDWVDHSKLWRILREMGIPDVPLEKPVCRSGSNS